MPQASEMVLPATSSGLGVGISGYLLNSVKGQAVLVNALMSNSIAFFLLSVGCFALAFGIGQCLYQKRDTRKWGSLAGFSSGGGFSGVLPFIVQLWMLHDLQNVSLTAISNSYVILMSVIGLILLGIGVLVIHTQVK